MNILIINCSPVRNGATAEIVNIVREAVESGNEVRAVCIDDYRIGFCRGCRKCHTTAVCFQHDDVEKLMAEYEWADRIVSVSPSYWADIPGQFKAFIDRCTPWCNTHEPHAALSGGKKGYSIVLRTGPGMAECERVISSIEHFYGHLEIEACGKLGLTSVEYKEDVSARKEEIMEFCRQIRAEEMTAENNGAYRFVSLREQPELKEPAAAWFHSKWGVPEEAYLSCMEDYLSGQTELGWFLCLDGEKIAGGLGVIENDFHDRKDLTPNICAVYTEDAYRKQGIAGKLLDMAVSACREKGISPVYLITSHIGFYERYGWEFYCMVQDEDSDHRSRLYIHR